MTAEQVARVRYWLELFDPESEDDVDHDNFVFALEHLRDALNEIERLKAAETQICVNAYKEGYRDALRDYDIRPDE